jgi:hypothetical protein
VGIPVKVNADSGASRTAFQSEGEQPSERSDAGVMIVQEVFGFVKRGGPGEMVRSEAQEVRRGLGCRGKGPQPLCPCFLVVEERIMGRSHS